MTLVILYVWDNVRLLLSAFLPWQAFVGHEFVAIFIIESFYVVILQTKTSVQQQSTG